MSRSAHFDALWFAAGVFLITTGSAAAQTPVPPGSIDVNPYGQGQNFGDVDCHQMRENCLHHDELGAQGRGACQTYRQLCRGNNRATRTPGY